MKTSNPKQKPTAKDLLPVSLDISDWTPQDRMVKYRMPYKSSADEVVQGEIIGFTIYPANNWRAAIVCYHPTKFTAHGGTIIEPSIAMGEEKGEYQFLFPNEMVQKLLEPKKAKKKKEVAQPFVNPEDDEDDEEAEDDDSSGDEEGTPAQAAPSAMAANGDTTKGQRTTAARTTRLQEDFI